jgi:hypothetical protein
VLLAGAVARKANVIPSVERSISKPVSFVAESVQLSRIEVLESGAAANAEGVAGTVSEIVMERVT